MPHLMGRILAAIAAAAVLIGSFFIGAIAVVTLFGLAVLAWVGAMLRIVWLRRRARDPGTGPTTVDGEYRVIDKRRDGERDR